MIFYASAVVVLNKTKSQILQGPTCLDDLTELRGIPIVKSVKYLGYNLAATKTKLLHSAQNNIKKHMTVIRSKLKLADETVQKILTEAYGRSLLVYFGTPLVVAGVWGLEKISNKELF